MRKPKVFVSRVIPQRGLKLVQEFCQAVVWQDTLPPSREDYLRQVQGIDGLLCLLTDPIDEPLMQAAGPNLRVISNHAVGVDNIDLAAATRLGIPVGNTPGILTETTADFAFALLMAAARRVVEGERSVRTGGWQTWHPLFLLGVDIHAATLGIIGFGRIGKAMARRASGFGMRILFYDPMQDLDIEAKKYGAQRVELDTLLAGSDFVSIHTPLNDQTFHLIDQVALEKMKPGAILINTARGGVVDQQALYQALKEKRIAGAALDVTDPEPLPADSPLLELENILITPHIASASHATREKMAVMAAENLIAGLRGERLTNCANPEVYGAEVGMEKKD
jgi:lactate dehydrogenase-like 2-hydroxyacid dehydrogenase